MKFVKMQCSACGAAIETKNGLKEIECSYCGTKFAVDPKQFTSEEFHEYFNSVDEDQLKTIKQDIEVLKELEELEPREAKTRYQLDKLKKHQKELLEKSGKTPPILAIVGALSLLVLFSMRPGWAMLLGVAAGAAIYFFYPQLIRLIKKEEWGKWRNYSPIVGVLLIGLFTAGPGVVFLYVILVAAVFLVSGRKQKKTAEDLAASETELMETEKLYDECVRALGSARTKQDLSYVTEEYRNVDALEYIYTALQNGKCKTISKAVELYEDHKFKEQMMENQRQQAETIRMQREEIERMKQQQAQNQTQTQTPRASGKKTKTEIVEDLIEESTDDADLKKVLAGAAVVGAVAYKNRKKIAKVGKAVMKGISKL